MQSVPLKGWIIIQESSQASGRPLWLSLINKALKGNFQVEVVLLLELEESLRRIELLSHEK